MTINCIVQMYARSPFSNEEHILVQEAVLPRISPNSFFTFFNLEPLQQKVEETEFYDEEAFLEWNKAAPTLKLKQLKEICLFPKVLYLPDDEDILCVFKPIPVIDFGKT